MLQLLSIIILIIIPLFHTIVDNLQLHNIRFAITCIGTEHHHPNCIVLFSDRGRHCVNNLAAVITWEWRCWVSKPLLAHPTMPHSLSYVKLNRHNFGNTQLANLTTRINEFFGILWNCYNSFCNSVLENNVVWDAGLNVCCRCYQSCFYFT